MRGFSALQSVFLSLHILYHDIEKIPLRGGVLQHLPGLVGVEVDLNQVLVPHRQQAVAGDVLRNIVVDVVLREVFPLDQQWVSKRYSSIPCSPL